ncbi:MAG: serine hydrolase [Microcystaceae cyanobacterium]
MTSLHIAEEKEVKYTPVRVTRKPNLVQSSLLYVVRLGILGAGLGVLVGTVLTFITPSRLLPSQASSGEVAPQGEQARGFKPQAFLAKLTTGLTQGTKISNISSPQSVTETAEIATLKQKLTTLATQAKSKKVLAQAYFIDLDNGQYVNVGGDTPIAAASTIKIPVAIAFFQDVDAGKIKLDEILPMSKELIASGSGDMQYQQGKNKSFTALETVTKMIIISDNTATNMLIKRLGGKTVLNQRFQQWGLSQTVIKNALPDLEGTNLTTPHDLAKALLKVNQGELISLKSRDRLLNIMQETKTRTLLPQGLESGAVIAHKTGDIGTVLGDAGIIDMPNGKRYIGVVMAKRPFNDNNARILIQNMSRTAYQHLKNTTPTKTAIAAQPKPENKTAAKPKAETITQPQTPKTQP